MKTGSKSLIIAVACIAGVACSGLPRATEGGRLRPIWESISDSEHLRVRGVGAPSAGAVGQTRRRALSRQAALVEARYHMLGTVKGFRLSGGVSVSMLAERNSLVREIVDDVVEGAEVALTEFLADDSCVVTLELHRDKVKKLIKDKTERERDLEAQVARDIDEIRKLRFAVEAATLSDREVRNMQEVRDKAEAAVRVGEKLDRLNQKLDRLDPNNDAQAQEILRDYIEAADEVKKLDDSCKWNPLRLCYW